MALLTHGVLDGLKHGYPLTPPVDVLVSLLLALAWVALVRPPFRSLVACAIAAAILPDVIDHTPWMLRREGLVVPWFESGPFFPWHWRDGSGSLKVGGDPARDLRHGANALVSLTNELIVVALALGGILAAPWAFRFVPARPSRPGA
jgi:hypothetical protein